VRCETNQSFGPPVLINYSRHHHAVKS
jgi:hypothetical protein